MLLKFTKIIASLALLTSLAGCVSPPKIQQNLIADELSIWQATGKLGIVLNGKSHAVNFKWQQTDSLFNIRLNGAMGLGAVKLSNTNGEVELQTQDGIDRATTAESLMEQSLGWSAPVSALTYWIRGLASPEIKVDEATRDSQQNLASLEQQGWMIKYREYYDYGALRMPKKIVATRGDLALTLVIKSWKFH